MLHVRCPHCRHVQPLADPRPGVVCECTACGQAFRPKLPPAPAATAPRPAFGSGSATAAPPPAAKPARPAAKPAPPPRPAVAPRPPAATVRATTWDDRPLPPRRPAVCDDDEDDRPRTRRRRRQSIRPSNPLRPVTDRLGAFGLVLVGWVVAWAVCLPFGLANQQLGGDLFFLHMMPFFLGVVWVVCLAFTGGQPLWGVGIILLPFPVLWVYILVDFRDTWRPFVLMVMSGALSVAGFLALHLKHGRPAPPPDPDPPPGVVPPMGGLPKPAPPGVPELPGPVADPNGPPKPTPDPKAPAPPPPVAFDLPAWDGSFYLADLQEFDVKPGPWPYAKDGTIGSPDRKPITVAGRKHPRGLGMHPPSGGYAGAKFRTGRRAATLEGSAALDDSAKDQPAAATFEVWGDGRRLWQSPPVKEKGKPVPFRVELAGVDVLELRVSTPSYHGVHAVWVDPRLTPAEGK